MRTCFSGIRLLNQIGTYSVGENSSQLFKSHLITKKRDIRFKDTVLK